MKILAENIGRVVARMYGYRWGGVMFCLALLVGSVGLASPVAPPKIVCDAPVYAFGAQSNTGSVDHVFVLRNAGGSPLKISKVRSCCGASAAVGAVEIPAGSNTTLTVSLRLRGRHGKQRKSFYVSSNDPKIPYLRLSLTGMVTANVVMSPSTLNFGSVARDRPVTNAVAFTFSARPETLITGAVSSSEYFAADIPASGLARQVVVCTVPPLPSGISQGRISVSTDAPVRSEHTFTVSASVTEDLLVIPREIILAGEGDHLHPVSHYIAVRSRSGTLFKISSIDLPDELATAVVTPMRRGLALRAQGTDPVGRIGWQQRCHPHISPCLSRDGDPDTRGGPRYSG